MEQRTIEMAWYKGVKEIQVPEKNIIDVLIPEDLKKTDDLKGLIHHHLDNPIGTPKFNQLCKGKRRICVIISDLSRPMETEKILPVVLERICKASPEAKVEILIAQGTHRALTPEEKLVLCGEEVLKNYTVHDHAFDDPNQLQQIPTDNPDFPILVNKLLMECDLRIGIGAVKPHPIFGWSGGAKIIIPGVSGHETTGLSHWRSCPYRGVDIMGLVDNPVRSEVEEVVVGENLLDFILNAVLTDHSEVADLRCGHVVQAHRACVDIAKRYYLQDVKEPVDAVIVGVGKWGADFWVGSMAIYQTEFFLRKGGTVVALEACPEGVSSMHPEIVEYGYGPYDKVRPLAEGGPLSHDLTLAAHLVHVGRVLEAREARCAILSDGIPAQEAEKLGFEYLSSVEEIMPYLVKRHGEGVRVLVIPGFNSTAIISEHPAE